MKKRLSISLLFFLIVISFFYSDAHCSRGGDFIKIISPKNNVWVTEPQIFLAGAVADRSIKKVTVRGLRAVPKMREVPVDGKGFGVMVSLRAGLNTIEVKAGGKKVSLKVFYAPRANKLTPPKGFKRMYLHHNPAPLKCRECHRKRRGVYNFKRIIPARSDCTTSKCHGNSMSKEAHVHGPAGAGACISCHSPHGSLLPKELERKGNDLCLACHQAKKEWLKEANVHPPVKENCLSCHDPHQSPARFQLTMKGKVVSELCFNCHEKTIFTKAHQHGPVGAGDCIACHRPHASKYKNLLIAPLDNGKVCFQCHSDRRASFNRKFVHKPVAQNCGLCHDPHSTDYRYQLRKPVSILCRSCHERLNPEVFRDIDDANYKHPPVSKGKCTECHDAHSSNIKSMLDKKMPNLCFKCHEELGYDIQDSKYLHGPVRTGDCSACHRVHGSKYTRLLVRYFPKQFYTPYAESKYDLCFGCHNKSIAKKKFTKELTNFRDGSYNLHFFHVNRKKGRSCIACHDPHASNQAKHIRYEVPFGSWSYPIIFTKMPTGGSCVVGCHAPKQYDRVHPKLKRKKK